MTNILWPTCNEQPHIMQLFIYRFLIMDYTSGLLTGTGAITLDEDIVTNSQAIVQIRLSILASIVTTDLVWVQGASTYVGFSWSKNGSKKNKTQHDLCVTHHHLVNCIYLLLQYTDMWLTRKCFISIYINIMSPDLILWYECRQDSFCYLNEIVQDSLEII